MSEKSKPKVSKSGVERLYSLMDLRLPGYLRPIVISLPKDIQVCPFANWQALMDCNSSAVMVNDSGSIAALYPLATPQAQ
jgi:hypothetical protein